MSFSNKRFRMGNITRDLEVVYNIRQRMGKAGNHHPHQPEEFLQRFQLSAGQQCEKNPLRGTVKIMRDFRLPPTRRRKLRSSVMLHSVSFHVSGQLIGFIFRGQATDLCCMTSQNSETSTLKIQGRSGGRCTELLSVAPV
jgi:hypothetical protein